MYNILRTLTRDRRPLVWFQCVWVTENVCRFLAGFGRVLADGVTARVVFMQDCFHADCFHARLFSCRLSSCKIVSRQDCFHARLSSCKIVFMQIVFMQDYFHARLLSCRISCNMQGDFCAFSRKSHQNQGPEAPKSTPEAPKSTLERPWSGRKRRQAANK